MQQRLAVILRIEKKVYLISNNQLSMKRILQLVFLCVFSSLQAQNIVTITADITADARWTSNNIYVLSGASFIYVTNNAVLTIEPGTIVKGDPAALVITRGSKIIADGTADQPIVFTSNKAAGDRKPGDWGGLLLLGRARVNCPGGECNVEGGLDPVLGKYGGTDDADNSGILRYVRIEFAGIAFQPNNETNSLTLGGVGSGTVIERVQTSFGGDDAFEWFGGVVNGRYLLAYKTVDDMFDTDFGYTGMNQFLMGISDPNLADISSSNGFEADNDAQGTLNTPVSQAVFSNVTLIGPRQDATTQFNNLFRRAAHLRRSTKQSIVNSILGGFPQGVRLESANSENFFLNTKELKFRNNILASNGRLFDSSSVNTPTVEAQFRTENRVFTNWSEVGLVDPYNGSRANALPAAGSAALTGANFDSLSTFFQKVNYVGAFGNVDWTGCWAEFDPVNANYNVVPLKYFNENVSVNADISVGQVRFSTNLPAGYTYVWNFGDSTAVSTEAEPVHQYAKSGRFTVSVRIINARGCVKNLTTVVEIRLDQNVVLVTSNITNDTKWTRDNIYVLTGSAFIYVTNNATLTIEPGTLIKGEPAALVITRGSKIIADGLVDQPIVFTSNKAAGDRKPGDWGGLLLLGRARVNCPGGECNVEGGLDPTLGKYGGTDDTDNSGILRYVRIEFAGIAFQPNNETNSITLGGVGSGTVIEHVQTSFGGDDAFEWFGGVVNGRYLLAYKTVDDMFDTDFGYKGMNQFVLGVSDPNLADISSSNGFEADNDAQGTVNTPVSQSIFSNVTLIGPRKDATSQFNNLFRRAAHLRRSTKQSIVNSILGGFPQGVRLESANSENFYLNTGEIMFRNNIMASNGRLFDSSSVNTPTVQAKFITENRVFTTWGEAGLNDPYAAPKVNALPNAGSAALTGASFANMPAYFENVAYVGAFGSSNWTDCWAEYDPVNADYSRAPIQYFSESVLIRTNVNGNSVDFSSNLSGNFTYEWNFGDNSPVAREAAPRHTYQQSGPYTVKLKVINARGCVKEIETTINITVSSNDLEKNASLAIMPNPNNGNFLVEIQSSRTESVQIELINHLGKSTLNQNIQLQEGVNSLEFNGVLPGFYQLRIRNTSGHVSQKVLVF